MYHICSSTGVKYFVVRPPNNSTPKHLCKIIPLYAVFLDFFPETLNIYVYLDFIYRCLFQSRSSPRSARSWSAASVIYTQTISFIETWRYISYRPTWPGPYVFHCSSPTTCYWEWRDKWRLLTLALLQRSRQAKENIWELFRSMTTSCQNFYDTLEQKRVIDLRPCHITCKFDPKNGNSPFYHINKLRKQL